jgi:hypothetical membrane protein
MMVIKLGSIDISNKIEWLKNRIDSFRQKLPFFLKKLNIHTAVAVAGIVGPILLTVGDLTAALADPNYSLVKNSISSLALTNIGWLQTIGFLSLGLLVEIFTTGLMFSVKRYKWFHLGIALLVFFGFAMLLIGAFHTDPVGIAERTEEGRIHGYSATTAFTLFPFAVLCLIPSFKRDNNWRDHYRYSQITFYLSIVLLVLTRIFQEGSEVFGLMERLLVVNMVIWVEVVAVRLFMLSLKRSRETMFNFTELP